MEMIAYEWIERKSAAGILEQLRARSIGHIGLRGTRNSQPFIDWILENKIEAILADPCTINFQHEEDLVAFKLKFGL
jgi:hypothetical protein